MKKETFLKQTGLTDAQFSGTAITGACELGVKQWIESVGITQDEIRADELLPILEKTNAYRLDVFKRLITF